MLLDTLREDCEHWIASYNALFMNECEMQLRLSNYLSSRQDHYDKVHVEYAVPLEFWSRMAGSSSLTEKLGLRDNDSENSEDAEDTEDLEETEAAKKTRNPKDPLETNMYIDIVVEKKGKFAAVELKYATALIDEKLPVFDEKEMVDVIKNTGGQNNKRYDYWYDVCRIEALTRFPNVEGGITLMVSNDNTYWENPAPDRKEPDYAAFSMRKGHTISPGTLDWKIKSQSQGKRSRPAFILDKSYKCLWQDTQMPTKAIKNNTSFRYLMLKITKVNKQ